MASHLENNFLFLQYTNDNIEKKIQIKFEYIKYCNFIINIIDDFGVNINDFLLNNTYFNNNDFVNDMLIYSNNINEKSIQIILNLLECVLFLENNHIDFLQLFIRNILISQKNEKYKININDEYYIFIYQKLKDNLLHSFININNLNVNNNDDIFNTNIYLQELSYISTQILKFCDFFEIPILIEFINQFISKLIGLY